MEHNRTLEAIHHAFEHDVCHRLLLSKIKSRTSDNYIRASQSGKILIDSSVQIWTKN